MATPCAKPTLIEPRRHHARRALWIFAAAATLSLAFAGPAAARTSNTHSAAKSTGATHSTATGGSSSNAAAARQAATPRVPTREATALTPASHAAGNSGTSGTVTSPQPISKADAHTGGANGQCPGGAYCSTRNGAPSGNGNGNGIAVGKPCAGCVGKADNKNPQGQRPNGSDHNAGYECDRNHGIGRTNPAHTGCAPSTPGCVATATNPCTPGSGCVATATNPCTPGSGCVATATNPCTPGSGCVATATNPCTSGSGCVATGTCGTSGESTTRGAARVQFASAANATAKPALASTGSDTETMLLYALALLTLGTAASAAGSSALRRRR